jgi:chorismate mutase/prephenate dehydratase
MAKKSQAHHSEGIKPAKSPTAAQLAKSIRELDRRLVQLLNERATLSQQLAHKSHPNGGTEFDLAAESHTIDSATGASRGPLSDHTIRSVMRELVSGTRSLLKPLRAVYLGPEYSYSHMAAEERFGDSAELVPVATIAAVFEEIQREQADFGLVPVENSTDGRVADTLEMFARMPVRVCGEVQLRIHHHLLAKCRREEVREVYSKPQALSQCRDWLATHLPDARVMESTSTAAAARLAAKKTGVAAIASRRAGSRYGLDLIAPNIEDNRNNTTRFAVIGHDTGTRTGRDKTSVMFELAHRPGALADAMGIFKRHALNLTWIESFPMPGTANEYLFFIEFVGHETDESACRALASLQRKATRVVILGSYPVHMAEE